MGVFRSALACRIGDNDSSRFVSDKGVRRGIIAVERVFIDYKDWIKIRHQFMPIHRHGRLIIPDIIQIKAFHLLGHEAVSHHHRTKQCRLIISSGILTGGFHSRAEDVYLRGIPNTLFRGTRRRCVPVRGR